jgi:hypothetical protein
MRSPSFVALLALLAVAAGSCAGPSFETGGGAGGLSPGEGGHTAGTVGGGAGGRGGTGGSGGSAGRGAAGRGGSAGQAGASGLGGTGAAGRATGGGDLGGEAGVGAAGASSGCSCAPGQYCRGDECLDCSDLSQLELGTPEPILDHPDRPLRFPRPGDVAGSLFFTLGSDSGGELWYEPSIDAPPGAPLGAATTLGRSGLFYFDDPGDTGFNALFDETDEGGRRSLRAARFFQGALTMIEDAPSPIAPGNYDDYGVALAPQTGRFYWMSARDGGVTLYTGLLGTSKGEPVEVRVATGSCVLAVDAPWVSSDGALLIVAAPPLDADCRPLDGAATDLYATPLNASTGYPLAPAIALSGVNGSVDTSSETGAAFSNDLCTLYFASDGGSAAGFDFRLFRATRR